MILNICSDFKKKKKMGINLDINFIAIANINTTS